MPRLINADKLESEMYHNAFEIDTDLQKWDSGCWIRYKMFENVIDEQPTVEAIPVQQLLSIFPKYDDYIHTKTYPYNNTIEEIYSKGYEEGWDACLKAIKEELDYWENENKRGK